MKEKVIGILGGMGPEAAISSILAGYFVVPAVLVTGDDKVVVYHTYIAAFVYHTQAQEGLNKVS